ncbi:unnamed protein product [Prorocentrum cordatum]|uniref:Uncharacterized protein n=1 Tax=Prorocentrum cordatum TaxID=2364126 RepID=A0ABN9XTU0_9DINO|nr:unnamed protein product [Polarella glacialis]
MLLDATSPTAALHYWELYKDVLVLSAKVLVISTWADSAVWGHHLTGIWRSDPMCTCERIRHRRSRDGLATYAQIAATASQLSAARARGGHAAVAGDPAKPMTLQATVHIPLGTTGPLEDWLPAALSRATAQQGLPTLRRAGDDAGLRMHEWRPLRDVEGRWMGNVVVQLATEAEIRHSMGLCMECAWPSTVTTLPSRCARITWTWTRAGGSVREVGID